MSISSMRMEISHLETEINKNNKEIRKLEDRNDELKKIREKFDETGEKLHDYQSRRRTRYEDLRYTLRNTKFVVQNADVMLEYIDGSYSKKAGEGVYLCIKKIEETIKKNEDKIEELKRRNAHLRNRISDLNDAIRREEERERERRRRREKKKNN